MPSITVKGMSCGHCRQAVTQALEAFPGVSNVTVDLASGIASWEEKTPIPTQDITKAIEKIGFEVA